MKNSIAERLLRLDPVRLAWSSALAAFAVVGVVLWLFPDLRVSVLEITVPEKPDPAEMERRRAEVKKPEPNERQVKEIAERVERKKKEELRQKVRELEKSLEDLEQVEEQRREALGLDPADAFRALVEAIRAKATALEKSGQIEAGARILREQADGLSRFESMESPGLAGSAGQLYRASTGHAEALRGKRDGLAPEDSPGRTRVERALQDTLQLTDLVERLVRRLPEGTDVSELPEELAAQAALAPLDEVQLEAMNAAELYDHALLLDQALRQEFADARAAELAAVQQTSLEEALARVDTPQGNAPAMTEALAQDAPSTRAEFQEYNRALEQASAAMTAMQLQASGMVAQARGFSAQGPAAETARVSRMQQALQTAAAGNQVGGQVVDLAPMMRGLFRMGTTGEGGGSQRNDPTQMRVGGAGTEMGATSVTGQDRVLQLRDDEIVAQLLPGRKFSRTSQRRGWLYIDTWYVLGPFQKPEGSGLSYDTRFPPETRVDLDGEYPGKIHPQTGRPIALRWRFFQSNTLKITPPDEVDGSVYFAYTEVFFEEEEEVLVAVASDDAAKVWINDLVVWEDTGLSSWRLDEGFRKVLFKKGYNTVLVRIENGPVACIYSLLLCPVGLNR
jgi:hypothetical protein